MKIIESCNLLTLKQLNTMIGAPVWCNELNRWVLITEIDTNKKILMGGSRKVDSIGIIDCRITKYDLSYFTFCKTEPTEQSVVW